MRRGVVHVNLDVSGALDPASATTLVNELRDLGIEVVDADQTRVSATRREVDLVIVGEDDAQLRESALSACAQAAAELDVTRPQPRVLSVSFISTGTEQDARGVLAAFGFVADVADVQLADELTATVVLREPAWGHPARAKLQTALEAALNREVRFVRG